MDSTFIVVLNLNPFGMVASQGWFVQMVDFWKIKKKIWAYKLSTS